MPASDHPVISIFGDTSITEQLLGCRFQVSPQSFFQVNTEVAALLYDLAVKEASNNVNLSADDAAPMCLLDVCCGTGTIGICAAKLLSRGNGQTVIVGVDNCSTAIDNAIVNAGLNDITLAGSGSMSASTMASFLCSRAEAVMDTILSSGKMSTPIVAGSSVSSASAPQDPITNALTPLRSYFQSCEHYFAIVDPPREVNFLVVMMC